MSLSERFRLEGNGLYKAVADGLAPCLCSERMKKALQCYKRAYDTADTANEKASAAKNVAMASLKLASFDDSDQIQKYFYKESILYFNKGYEMGRDKPHTWHTALLQQMYQCLQGALDSFSQQKSNEKLHFLEELTSIVSENSIRAECWLEVGNIVFAQGISALQNEDFMTCLKAMHDCYRPIEEAVRFGQTHVKKEAEVLRQDVFMHLCVAESIQARRSGDNLLNVVLTEEEFFNMELTWDVLDQYKNAIILTREKDMEMEAIALSRIGIVYDRILKQKTKAKEAFMRSIQLAASLHPRNFGTEEWYTDSTQALERYQCEATMREDALKQEKYSKVKEEIKDVLTKVENNNTTAEDLLRYVYKEHPPKNKNHKLDDTALENAIEEIKTTRITQIMKKLLQKAVTHYHPDRVDEKEHGIQWKVLCEEITKVLTVRYERYK